MTRRQIYVPTPRWWNTEQVAARLGRSTQWLRDNMQSLENDGFPKKDTKYGMWDAVAIDKWFDGRSGLNSIANEEKDMLDAIYGKSESTLSAGRQG